MQMGPLSAAQLVPLTAVQKACRWADQTADSPAAQKEVLLALLLAAPMAALLAAQTAGLKAGKLVDCWGLHLVARSGRC
jgi:hypothetical protein